MDTKQVVSVLAKSLAGIVNLGEGDIKKIRPNKDAFTTPETKHTDKQEEKQEEKQQPQPQQQPQQQQQQRDLSWYI